MFGIRAELEFIHEDGSGGHFLKLEVFFLFVLFFVWLLWVIVAACGI